MIIDCRQCDMHQSDHCKDCLVMAVISHDGEAPLEISSEHEAAIESLQQAGLAPVLRFRRKAG